MKQNETKIKTKTSFLFFQIIFLPRSRETTERVGKESGRGEMDRHGEKEKESRIDCTVYIRGQRMEKKKEEKSKKEKENNWKKKKGRTNKNTDDIAGC